ncbi:UNVERIFIED_CONTAM: hypothetical protein FKN15_038208 [Acipenser sinensis]
MTADDMMISVDGDESSCCSFNESLVQAGEDSGSCTTSASSSLSTPSPGISAEDVNAKKGAANKRKQYEEYECEQHVLC